MICDKLDAIRSLVIFEMTFAVERTYRFINLYVHQYNTKNKKYCYIHANSIVI